MSKVDPIRSTLSTWNPMKDGRHGVRSIGSSTAFDVASRDGVRLHVPAELLRSGAGTFTRHEYDLWEEAS